jgi:hypothetical protein
MAGRMFRRRDSSEMDGRLWLSIAAGSIVVAVAGGGSLARASAPARDGAQIDAGYHADVTDLKTTVSYSQADDRTEVSLALVPPVPAGGPGISLVFRARFRGRSIDTSRLEDIVVRAHYVVHSDDRARAAGALSASLALHMNIDPNDPGGIELDFFPVTVGYPGFANPGDEIPVAFFSMTPADLRALALARVITGDVLWTGFTLTSDEIQAMRQFARTVLPPVRPTL